ncbi:MAG: hypothetical protein QI199_06670, partial [Candidatus Korarchaeota archaeon]|nr:hypothetical protein [Candidatus Korarchaeota archaeon]
MEVIRVEDLRDSDLFVAVDLVVSLTGASSPDEVKSGAESLLRELSRKVRLRAEDSKKSNVALALPERRHLEEVKGKWTKWVWKRTAYDGNPAPDFDGWVRDLTALADAIRGEGARAVFMAGESGKVLEEMGYEVVRVSIEKTLPKLGYPRDPSVAWSEQPILMNMALDIRRGEEEVTRSFFQKEGLTPVFRPRWWRNGKLLVMAKAEGGNFILIEGDGGKQALFTGIGVRGSNVATLKLLQEFLISQGLNIEMYGIPLPGYIRDWRTGAVHLDVVMMHAGPVTFVSPGRMGFYSLVKYGESLEILELGQVFRDLGITVDEILAVGSEITMVNGLNLGDGKLVVDSFNRDANKYLEREWGLDLIEVDIPQV